MSRPVVLVTGAAGFIGSHFLQHYVKKHPETLVVCLDKAPTDQWEMNVFGKWDRNGALANCGVPLRSDIEDLNFIGIRGEIGDAKLLEDIFMRLGPNKVINFAAESHVDRSIDGPAAFIDSNVLQLTTLLEACRTYRDMNTFKFLQVSTDEVYGCHEEYGEDYPGGFNEHAPLHPGSVYSASKAAADLLVMSYGRTHGLRWKITRSANNYGPRQMPEKLIPLMIAKSVGRQPLPIYGDGKQCRDWIHVRDNVKILANVLDGDCCHEVINVGAEHTTENLTLVKCIWDLINDDEAPIEHVEDRPGHDRSYVLDCMQMHCQMSLQPKPIAMYLGETVKWYRENPEWIEKARQLGYSTDRVGLGG